MASCLFIPQPFAHLFGQENFLFYNFHPIILLIFLFDFIFTQILGKSV